ncbi:MAG TPA: homoprotocatechuate degradation operon regulator HpaR [Gammaproteobacteria bacterium]|nr:homoprotocatechuate degradation operon regulator HpaR [Gammaproteobacteria bacterium]
MPRFSDSLPMMLLRARETVMSRFRPMIHVRGITEQQWRALRALEDLGELSAAGLAAECSILAPSMTRILRKLSEQGLVTVTKSRLDQRELKVRISEKGKRLVAEVSPRIEAQYARLREQLGAERLEALYRELKHLIALGTPPGREHELPPVAAPALDDENGSVGDE